MSALLLSETKRVIGFAVKVDNDVATFQIYEQVRDAPVGWIKLTNGSLVPVNKKIRVRGGDTVLVKILQEEPCKSNI